MQLMEYAEEVWRDWETYNEAKKLTAVSALAYEFNKYEILSICGSDAKKLVEGLPEPERKNRFNPKTLGAMQGMKRMFYNGTGDYNVNSRIILSVVEAGTDLATVARLTTIPIEHLRAATMTHD